ncbi:hypothetical protein TNCV_2493681 [Trichonephila clavipes]|uniref:Uncharacterized protein n=1 Tax=Trichonephila clavipes TaxID=2585209 RepID=A0A8X6RU99_TRICX|nr:hypothetical protein TNCV_2493681 [Trichonephila clavipes]
MAARIRLPLQWILINESAGYIFSPLTGPRMSPISSYFKDSVSIDTEERALLALQCPYSVFALHREQVTTNCKGCFFKRTTTAGSDVVQSGRPIFDDFFQHLWPYIGNNTANVVFQMVKRLWLIRIDQ